MLYQGLCSDCGHSPSGIKIEKKTLKNRSSEKNGAVLDEILQVMHAIMYGIIQFGPIKGLTLQHSSI